MRWCGSLYSAVGCRSVALWIASSSAVFFFSGSCRASRLRPAHCSRDFGRAGWRFVVRRLAAVKSLSASAFLSMQ